MLETEMKKLTAALTANTAALLTGSAPVAPTAETPKPSTAKAAPVAEPPTPAAEAPAVDVPPADKKKLVEKVIELAKTKGRETAAKLLAEYGATKVPELKDASKYGEIVAKIDALLA